MVFQINGFGAEIFSAGTQMSTIVDNEMDDDFTLIVEVADAMLLRISQVRIDRWCLA